MRTPFIIWLSLGATPSFYGTNADTLRRLDRRRQPHDWPRKLCVHFILGMFQCYDPLKTALYNHIVCTFIDLFEFSCVYTTFYILIFLFWCLSGILSFIHRILFACLCINGWVIRAFLSLTLSLLGTLLAALPTGSWPNRRTFRQHCYSIAVGEITGNSMGAGKVFFWVC